MPLPDRVNYTQVSKIGGSVVRLGKLSLKVLPIIGNLLTAWELFEAIQEIGEPETLKDIYRVLVPELTSNPGYRVSLPRATAEMLITLMGPLQDWTPHVGVPVTESDASTGPSTGSATLVLTDWGNEESWTPSGLEEALKRANVLAARSPATVDAYPTGGGPVEKTSLDELISTVITESRRVI